MQQRDLGLDRVQVVLLEEAGSAARPELQSVPEGDHASTTGAESSAESATARYLLPPMVRSVLCVATKRKGARPRRRYLSTPTVSSQAPDFFFFFLVPGAGHSADCSLAKSLVSGARPCRACESVEILRRLCVLEDVHCVPPLSFALTSVARPVLCALPTPQNKKMSSVCGVLSPLSPLAFVVHELCRTREGTCVLWWR